MDRFFSLLRENHFDVIYDTEYITEWTNIDTDENRKAICSHIIEIYCPCSSLTELPELPNVCRLDCSHNQITKLPKLLHVEILSCENNQLIELGQIPNIQTLFCSNNMLTNLPELFYIKALYCDNNELSMLPELPYVENLNCSDNKLAVLPELPNIQFLNCSYNKLTTLPELPQMQSLYFYHNQLFSDNLEDWKKVWKCKNIFIAVYVVPKLFIRWKLTTIRNRLSVEHKEAIICHPKTYYVRELYNENNI